MMAYVLQVAASEGGSGKILSSAGDYLFRYHEEAKAQAAISLLMPVRLDVRAGTACGRGNQTVC